MTTATLRAFLDVILDDPDEDAHRLILADWLEDHDQAARAAWIRASCELERADVGESERKELEKQVASLRSACRPSWWRDFPHELEVEPRRGLYSIAVESLTGVNRLGRSRRVARAVAEGWVEKINIEAYTGSAIKALARWPEQLCLAPLSVEVPLHVLARGDQGLSALPGLRWLTVRERIEESGPDDLSFLAGLPGLRSLFLWEAATYLRDVAGLRGLRDLNLRADRLTDAGLAPLAGLTQLGKLRVMAPHDIGPTLAPLSGLTGLRELDLSFQPLTDEAMPALAGLSDLRVLDLSLTKVTDRGLRHLAGLSALESLTLSNSSEIRSLRWIAGLKHLRHLRVFGCNVTDNQLAHLAGLTRLRELSLGYSGELGGAGLRRLEGLPELAVLDLHGCEGLKEGLSSLVKITSLRRLYLQGCQGLAGSKFAALADLPHLHTLTIPRRGRGEAQAARLRKRHPRLTVETG